MLRIAQPLERGHFSGDKLNAVTCQTVKSGVTVTHIARAARVAYHPNLQLLLHQTQRGLE